MLIDLNRVVAYICPFCANVASKTLSVFDFSGRNKVNLICPTRGCHEDCVYISQKNSQYILKIECPMCGEQHSYTVSKESFWHKPLISYKCPMAGIDIFFAGEEKYVDTALKESCDMFQDAVEDIFENASFDIAYAIIERIHFLMSSKGVSCVCGHNDASLEMVDGKIVVTCKKCHKSKSFESSEDTFAKLLSTHAIVIGS